MDNRFERVRKHTVRRRGESWCEITVKIEGKEKSKVWPLENLGINILIVGGRRNTEYKESELNSIRGI